MINEILFIGAVIINFLFIAGAMRFGTSGLLVMMTTNIILVSMFAPKLIDVFGLVSNVGNIFYGSVFLITNLILENFGKEDGVKALWLSFTGNILFVTMGQFALRFAGETGSAAVNDALPIVFGSVPRLALASIVAYIIVQYVNIWLYSYLKERFAGRKLWLRHGISISVAQFCDSVIFFAIAFAGILPLGVLIEVMSVGFLFKTVIGCAGTPIMYMGKYLKLNTYAN